MSGLTPSLSPIPQGPHFLFVFFQRQALQDATGLDLLSWLQKPPLGRIVLAHQPIIEMRLPAHRSAETTERRQGLTLFWPMHSLLPVNRPLVQLPGPAKPKAAPRLRCDAKRRFPQMVKRRLKPAPEARVEPDRRRSLWGNLVRGPSRRVMAWFSARESTPTRSPVVPFCPFLWEGSY